MAATWRLALLEVLAFLWTLSRTDASSESNTTTLSPSATLNGTVSTPENSPNVWGIIGRVAVALSIAGAVGVVLYCLKKKCPRPPMDDEHRPVVSRRRANRESRPLNGRSNSSQSSDTNPRPLLQQHNSDHTE
ncbi:unnamed protein product [Ophioblennius macclurei]